jgi:hypothetical protein
MLRAIEMYCSLYIGYYKQSLDLIYGIEWKYREACGNWLDQGALFEYRYGMFKVNAPIHPS